MQSVKEKQLPRFNTTSFSLVHSREKLWSITIFCLGRKKEEEEGEKLVLCVFSSLQNDQLYNGLVKEENSNNIKQGSKAGAKIRGLERITVINGVNCRELVKEALMVVALI